MAPPTGTSSTEKKITTKDRASPPPTTTTTSTTTTSSSGGGSSRQQGGGGGGSSHYQHRKKGSISWTRRSKSGGGKIGAASRAIGPTGATAKRSYSGGGAGGRVGTVQDVSTSSNMEASLKNQHNTDNSETLVDTSMRQHSYRGRGNRALSASDANNVAMTDESYTDEVLEENQDDFELSGGSSRFKEDFSSIMSRSFHMSQLKFPTSSSGNVDTTTTVPIQEDVELQEEQNSLLGKATAGKKTTRGSGSSSGGGLAGFFGMNKKSHSTSIHDEQDQSTVSGGKRPSTGSTFFLDRGQKYQVDQSVNLMDHADAATNATKNNLRRSQMLLQQQQRTSMVDVFLGAAGSRGGHHGHGHHMSSGASVVSVASGGGGGKDRKDNRSSSYGFLDQCNDCFLTVTALITAIMCSRAFWILLALTALIIMGVVVGFTQYPTLWMNQLNQHQQNTNNHHPNVPATTTTASSSSSSSTATATTPSVEFTDQVTLQKKKDTLVSLILNQKVQVTSQASLTQDSSSAAYQALEWMIKYDPHSYNMEQLKNNAHKAEARKLVERFVISTLYFTWHPNVKADDVQQPLQPSSPTTRTTTQNPKRFSETWNQATNWMTELHICQWYVVYMKLNSTYLDITSYSRVTY